MIFYFYADNSFIFELSKEIIVNVIAALVVHRILQSSKKTH